ncbi:hypothetical protein ACNHKD_16140 [Methylocystis sp. JAN1]|uniref:hypothetical protein n=1 Tax=Methylocystis sp. JAN1 TaxID=3397211 RepID=UPI003FA32DD9
MTASKGDVWMIYLLTLGWSWFSGALALGALVGFLTFSRARDATFSGGWVVALGVLALAAGGVISYAEILEGRDAALFDIAFAGALAYAAGLPLGGLVRSLGGAAETKRPALAPVLATPERVVEPAPAEAEAARPAAAPEPLIETARTPSPAPAPAPPRPKAAPGVKPETLDGPRDGAPDDLSRIKGVGPKSREKLNALGVFHYDQIAAWSLENARWIGAAIGAPGRVERDKWIQQARALAGAGGKQK